MDHPATGTGVAQFRTPLWTAVHQPVVIYLVAVLLVAVAFLLRGLLTSALAPQALYLFLVPPVLISGVLGGLGPGLVATALCLGMHLILTDGLAILIDR